MVEKAEGDLGAAGDVWPVDESLLNSLKEQYKRERVNAKRGAAIGAHLKAAVFGNASPDSAASAAAFDAPMGTNEGTYSYLISAQYLDCDYLYGVSICDD